MRQLRGSQGQPLWHHADHTGTRTVGTRNSTYRGAVGTGEQWVGTAESSAKDLTL